MRARWNGATGRLSGPRRLAGPAVAICAAALVSACAWIRPLTPGTSPGEGASEELLSEGLPTGSVPAIGVSEARFHEALGALERGEFEPAEEQLRGLAATCESGAWGRDAVLLLASVHLSPGNRGGSVDDGARMAAHYLQIRGAPGPSVAVAETLYLLAVDLGATPVEHPLDWPPGTDQPSFAFTDCAEAAEPVQLRELPVPPGQPTTSARIRTTSAQRDSLALRVDSLSARNAELEAELNRIRRLLAPGAPQGTGVSPGPLP